MLEFASNIGGEICFSFIIGLGFQTCGEFLQNLLKIQ
jgi:hypothetical protein